ncbi:MAG: LL-diaminopimelate aminotransferase [Candidatus Methanogaster sp.]|uniref:LL-diaminopimelate aminotransferase n=1 Tax=Candidatus Methanogaster sp. TaxID=3386292 RepID=A0AC61L6L0_9EURY|nr:MAG: LL-diaminopimelate aminotransferase [ANME-2 cluster archaeon]
MYAKRLTALPPYLFAAIDEAKENAIKHGVDVIDLGVGDPDLPPPAHIIDALCASAHDPKRHQYPSYAGMLTFREAAAEWYKKTFNITLDPGSEVLALIGSKEGLAHIPLAFVNPGDVVLVPDPAYPVYKIGTLFAGGVPYTMPLLAEAGFLPNLDAIPADVADKAKLIFLNYPNNPTAAVADLSFFKEVVDFASEHDIIVVHDNPYSEITFGKYRAPSLLSAPGAMDVGIEMHSLSKTYNMTGWRIGIACGNAEIISGLGAVKTNIDSGVFEPVQEAAITALTGPQDCISDMRKIYTERRDLMIAGLRTLGIDAVPPEATFYIWTPVPDGYTSLSFSAMLLEKIGIVATPGVGFGECGEGYVRFSLTSSTERIAEAVDRMHSV